MFGTKFKIKIKVEDDYLLYKQVISEDEQLLVTEDGNQIITEWSV